MAAVALCPAGAHAHVRGGHRGDGDHQFSDVDLLQPGSQLLHVLSHRVCHRDFCKHPQLSLPGLRAVRRVPGGPVVGRSLPHPVRAHAHPQEAAAHLEGAATQAAVAPLEPHAPARTGQRRPGQPRRTALRPPAVGGRWAFGPGPGPCSPEGAQPRPLQEELQPHWQCAPDAARCLCHPFHPHKPSRAQA